MSPGLAPTVVIVGILAAIGLGLVISRVVKTRFLVLGVVTLATVCVLAGPAAYSVSRISRSVTGLFAAAGPAPAAQSAAGGAGQGQPGGQPAVDRPLVAYLLANRKNAEFLVAVEGAPVAESIIISTGQPVMALGGFGGTDPWPTPALFRRLVTAGKVRYALMGGTSVAGWPGGGAAGTSSDIRQWVAQHGKVVDPSRYGGHSQGETLYQLP